MKKIGVETLVGIFLIVGFACFAYLAVKLGDVRFFGQDTYNIQAYFTNVGGLTEGADVEIAGVKVGRVEKITLDPKTYEAVVTLSIKNAVNIQEDSIASIRTAGIIGDKYITIKPGGAESYLKEDGMIFETESAINLEELVSKYIFEKK